MKKILFCLVLSLVFAIADTDILKKAEFICNNANNAPEICEKLGDIYFVENFLYGIERDDVKASKFYKRGCDIKGYVSCYKLAVNYQYGQGVKQDFDKAIEFYDKSCSAGLAGGCQLAALIYISVKKNALKGEEYYKKSCDTGDWLACGAFGAYYEKNGNIKKAVEYYKISCDLSKAHSRAIGALQNEDMLRYCNKYKVLK